MVTRSQAKQAVAVASALDAGIDYYSSDEDGTQPVVEGNDYPLDDNSHDIVAALNDIPDPEALLRIECVASDAEMLSQSEVAKITNGWPKNWRDQRSDRDG